MYITVRDITPDFSVKQKEGRSRLIPWSGINRCDRRARIPLQLHHDDHSPGMHQTSPLARRWPVVNSSRGGRFRVEAAGGGEDGPSLLSGCPGIPSEGACGVAGCSEGFTGSGEWLLGSVFLLDHHGSEDWGLNETRVLIVFGLYGRLLIPWLVFDPSIPQFIAL